MKSTRMINSGDFSKTLLDYNLGPIIQVPCSYFKDLFNYLLDSKQIEVINPVNEAIGIGLASGCYLSTKKIPILAIQNSGFLNTLNALTSLNQIYKIPIFYLISWRGEHSDAPEHTITGKNLLSTLDIMKIPYEIINSRVYQNQIKKLAKYAFKYKKPVALIIQKSTFAPYVIESNKGYQKNTLNLSRYEAIKIIKNMLKHNYLFISSTGYPSRDSFSAKNTADFYMVGSMGHTLSVALGVSLNITKKVVVLDGDGSALMHLGTLASFDSLRNKNIIYIILDNQIYDSTGGQPTVSSKINFSLLAQAFNFKNIHSIFNKTQLIKTLEKVNKNNGAFFIHILTNQTNRKDSPRVSDKYTCPQIKKYFMDNLEIRKSLLF